jgi:hypothetical protein
MNEIHNRYVATVIAPGPRLGGAVEAYRGWQPCIDWCIEQFGQTGWWYLSEGVFEFAREQDHLLFVLKWS